jgi:protein-tyrosine phosphatase
VTSSEIAPDRLIALEGAFNFRDLGGYTGVDERTLRWRRLFRADGLYRLTEADLDQLAALGLRTVIDLRTANELTSHGRIAWPSEDLTYHHLPLLDVLPPKETYPEWIRPEFVARQYLEMLTGGRESVTAALVALSDPASYPAVFHCMAGKDRTGILAAVVLGLLGVADADIVADYALSQAAMTKMGEWLRRTDPERAVELESSGSAIAAAAPAGMAGFLELFRAEYGTFPAFVEELGLPSVPSALRDLLLEP